MTVKAVKVALRELPKGSKALDSAYKEALQRIESQKLGCQQLAKSIMSWIVCAQNQLTTPELRCALAVEDESSELDEDNLPDMSEIIAVCAGLVIIDEKSDVIRLVHYTAHDYFERTTSVWAPIAEEMIAKTCLTYLSFGSVFESCSNFMARKGSTGVYDILCRDNVLVRYAARYWGYHAENCWTDSVEKRVLRFLEDKKRVASCFEVNFVPCGPAIRRGRQVTAMHLLAYFGLPTAMSKLLREGHSPDPKAVNGKTPLFYACYKGVGAIAGGQEDAVKLLLSQEGVDVNSMDESRSTPLLMAAWYGREAIATSLLDHQDIQINVRNNLGQTPLMIALEFGHCGIAQILLERYDVEQLDVAAGEGSHLLDLAITERNSTIARLLLQKHGIQVNYRTDLHFDHTDHYGRTLITKVVKAGDCEIVNLLLHQVGLQLSHHDFTVGVAMIRTAKALFEGVANIIFRAKTIDLYVEDDCGRNALTFSAKVELRGVPNLSLKPKVILVDKGPDILLLAVRFGLRDALAFLLKIENIQVNFKDEEEGCTALIMAAGRGHEDVLAMLLKEDDIDINIRDNDGRSALIHAAWEGHEDILAMLLKEDDIDVNIRDNDGQSALIHAAWEGHEDILAMLLKEDDIDINFRDKYDRNALMLAAKSGYPGMVSMLLENLDVQMNCKDLDGRTALMLAMELGHEDLLVMLLGKDDIDINLRDNDGRNALMLAAGWGKTDAVVMLLGRPDVQTNCKDIKGWTALMLAAWYGHADVVTQLLAKDDVLRDCKDLQGETALSLAAGEKHRNVMSLLH